MSPSWSPRADADELIIVRHLDKSGDTVVKFEEVILGCVVISQDTPNAAPPAVLRRVDAVRVVGSVPRLSAVDDDRRVEGELLGDAIVLGVSPASGARGAESRPSLEPLYAVDGCAVLVLVPSRLDLDP